MSLPEGRCPIADAPLARPTPAIPPVARRVTFTVDRAPEFLRVAEFIDQYRPSRRFDRELFLQIELAEALRGKFGREAVKTELPIPGGGRVDIEVCGVGDGLKIAASRPGSARLAVTVGELPGALRPEPDRGGV